MISGLVKRCLQEVFAYFSTELLLAVVIALLLTWLIKTTQQSIPGIPGPKPYPVIGNVCEMFQCEAADLFCQWTKEYGKILQYKVFLLGTQVLVADKDALHKVLVTNAKNYKKPETVLVPCRAMFGSRCLICLPPAEHDACRQIMNPAFTSSNIKKITNLYVKKANVLIRQWEEEFSSKKANKESKTVVKNVPVQKSITLLSLDILGVCVFGYEFNSLIDFGDALSAALHRILSIQTFNILRFLPLYSYFPTQLNKDTSRIKQLVLDVLEQKESTVEDLPADRQDMLDILLKTRNRYTNNDNEIIFEKSQQVEQTRITSQSSTFTLTDDDVVDDIHQFLIAGHETVTNTLCFALLQLAKHPEIQEKVRQEVCKFFPFQDQVVTESSGDSLVNDDLLEGEDGMNYFNVCNKLTYTDCVLKETMRLFPPVPLTLRQSIGEDNLGGYKIPPGTVIAVHLAALMKQEDYFANASEFLPERFLQDEAAPSNGSSTESKPMYTRKAFLPFLAGPDMCIGHKFAMYEMKVILGSILSRFKVTLDPEKTFTGKQGLTYHVSPPLELNIEQLKTG